MHEDGGDSRLAQPVNAFNNSKPTLSAANEAPAGSSSTSPVRDAFLYVNGALLCSLSLNLGCVMQFLLQCQTESK